jgi:hypothetical protein
LICNNQIRASINTKSLVIYYDEKGVPKSLFKTYMITCINNQLNIFIMKKVVLSISAMLLVGSVAMAQVNMSDVNQVGNSEVSIVNQHGNSNTSDVDQLGNRNKSEVYQGINPGSFNARSNAAEVMQDGNDNGAFISQSNKNNEAFQTQVGNKNTATIWQDQIVGAPLATRGSDWAKQEQTGNRNVATIDQGTSGNEKPVAPSVFSSDQLAAVAAVPVPVSPNYNNYALQVQNGNGNTAYASQGGVENHSFQYQTSPGAIGNTSNHYQYGRENTATTTQNGTMLLDNTMQIGNLNTSTVTQSGNGHESIAYSKGNNNSINVTQNNGM